MGTVSGTSYFGGGGMYLTVDMSNLRTKLELSRAVLSRSNFEKLMYRTFSEVGKRAKPPIAREVVQDYEVTQQWVKSQIGSSRISFGGGFPVTCQIPLKGAKGSIGGRFKLSSPARSKKQGKVRARVVKSNVSTMPDKMDHQGGNPPFVAKGVAYTRRTKERLPIVRVVGLGVPQMPLNRSESKVQDTLLELAMKRLDHNMQRMLNGQW